MGESLKRPPRGYDPEHPLMEDLKRKDYVAITSFSEADASRPDFLNRFTAINPTNAEPLRAHRLVHVVLPLPSCRPSVCRSPGCSWMAIM